MTPDYQLLKDCRKTKTRDKWRYKKDIFYINAASIELEGHTTDMEMQALKQQIASLTEEAEIYKAKLMVMNRRTRQRRLGEELRIKFLEKKEELERELIEANINLRYLIEKNRRLEFRDKLWEKLKIEKSPYKSEDLGSISDSSDQFAQNQAVYFDEVNHYLHAI